MQHHNSSCVRQVLCDGIGEAGADRRLEAEGGDDVGSRCDKSVQAGEPDRVRVGDQGPVVG